MKSALISLLIYFIINMCIRYILIILGWDISDSDSQKLWICISIIICIIIAYIKSIYETVVEINKKLK